MKYPDVSSSPDFPALERAVLEFWQKNGVFQRSIDQRPAKTATGENNEFIFYDGPPFANGLPHYGHLLTSFKKDLVARFQTQKGKRVERRFGWDCHGLPAEMETEKELGVSGRKSIQDYGVDKFNEHCRTSVMRYTKEWETYISRAARWVDFKNDYKTMDTSFMESVLWAFKQLYDKGLVYEAMRVMPYSWACETPLSNFETRMDNSYRERADKAVTVAFTLKEPPRGAPAGYRSYALLAWTTTPWTLPSNLALAVGESIEYAFVAKGDRCLIIAQSSIASYAKELTEQGEKEPIILGSITGKELLGLHYTPLFPYFTNTPSAFVVLGGDFVLEGDGTGVVHMAPGFGEDDQLLCQAHGIEVLCPVDEAGKFTSQVTDFAGMHVFEANDPIIIYLKEQGSWIKTEQYLHNYPHCWRTDTPLIYKAMPSWYVEVTKFRDRMVELNQQINWVPGHIRDGLFGKWLENAHDWSISRNRFWGTPIPVWKSDNPDYPRIEVYGSIAEMEQAFNVKITDLHKPFIDDLVRPNPDDPTGKSMMRRVPDVFDCWFESGSMPYAQVHYPFENKEWFEQHFPADFIVEYVAQTRGWFYTLMVLSTALFDRPPFLNCVCHGVILDEHGQKLSKRLRNYADPLEVFETYGADALRWLLMSTTVLRGNELLIDKDGKMVRDAVRLSLKPIWNSYHFFTLYANADGIEARFSTSSPDLMDRYILAKAKHALITVDQSLTAFDPMLATEAIDRFFEVLTNWYIRRNRHRFWQTEIDASKLSAYNTLFTVLHMMVRAAAPLLPFMCETIYAGLTQSGALVPDESVHLTLYPDVSLLEDEPLLVKQMDQVQAICNAALAVRNRENIRVRQPLAKLTIIGKNLKEIEPFKALIEDEVNVKTVLFSEQLEEHASLVLNLNFKQIGQRIPAKVKTLIPLAKQGEWKQQNGTVIVGDEVLQSGEYELLLKPKDATSSEALSSQDALVMLDLEVTEALYAEGLARDMIRLIQQARKEADYHVSDVIYLVIETEERLSALLQPYQSLIASQTLAENISFGMKPLTASHSLTAEIESISVTLHLSKKA